MCLIILLVVGYAGESKENVIEQDKIEQAAYRIILCESGGKHIGCWGAAGEYGWAQFKKKTFEWMKGLAGRPELKWKNKDDQMWLLKWAIKNNLSSHWTCAKKG